MSKKKLLEYQLQYDDSIKYAQDYDLWIRMLSLGEAYILDEELSVLRVSKKSNSYQNNRTQKIEGLLIRWSAFMKFGGNPAKVMYYFIKTLSGLIFSSK